MIEKWFNIKKHYVQYFKLLSEIGYLLMRNIWLLFKYIYGYEYYQEIIFNTIACCTATKCILIEISRLLNNLPTFSRLWKKNNKNLFCTVHDHSCLYSVILPRWFCWCFWLTARFCIASLARHVNNTRLN